MELNRATFLRILGCTAATAYLRPSPLLAASSTGPESARELRDLDLASFSEFIGTRFSIRDRTGRTVRVNLTEAVDDTLPPEKQPDIGRLETFSVLFRGPSKAALEQDTYWITHEHMGTFPLFIVPVDIQRDAVYYQAIFNRLHS